MSVAREAVTAMREAAEEITRLRRMYGVLLGALDDLDCSEILGVAESCASGMPRWEFVNARITRARAVIAQARAEA